MDRVNFEQLVRLIREVIGTRGQIQSASPESGDIVFVMYEAFGFKCGLDNRYGSFGMILPVEAGAAVRSFLGRDISLNADEESIRASLAIVDHYCRLRLPDKYLAQYDRTHS